MDPEPLQRALLRWYDRRGRRLPWRSAGDPYAVLVSEFMLQQTQASRVVGPYERFLGRFPNLHALSAAEPADVIRQWQGLGYNRRAVALHRTAQHIVSRYGGHIPQDPAVLMALPGIGGYTARAIAAFGFGRPVAPVDVNIARVLERAVVAGPLTPAALQRVADAQIAPGRPASSRPADWSQALMDLGALHCVARTPDCSGCPIRSSCAWRAGPQWADDPSSSRRRPQGRFAGSDRQFRGRLLDLARERSLSRSSVPARIGLGHDPQRAQRLVDDLVAEGSSWWLRALCASPGAWTRRSRCRVDGVFAVTVERAC